MLTWQWRTDVIPVCERPYWEFPWALTLETQAARRGDGCSWSHISVDSPACKSPWCCPSPAVIRTVLNYNRAALFFPMALVCLQLHNLLYNRFFNSALVCWFKIHCKRLLQESCSGDCTSHVALLSWTVVIHGLQHLTAAGYFTNTRFTSLVLTLKCNEHEHAYAVWNLQRNMHRGRYTVWFHSLSCKMHCYIF